MANIHACRQASYKLYLYLLFKQELEGIVTFRNHTGNYCFQVYFENLLKFPIVSGISISFPPDVNENLGPSKGDSEIPETIETALVQLSGKVCYINEL